MSHVQKPPLADDLLDGLVAIAKYIYGDGNTRMRRRVQYEHEKGHIPTFKNGGRVCARKSELDLHFSSQRGRAA
jgi:hypothetical protein